VDDATETGAADLWTRLRRRKVVQWGLAYAAGAWVLMQTLSYFSGTFDWSRQIQQVVTVAILVGAPIVLALAWYHGDRGQQRVTGSELAVLTLLLLVGGGLLWLYAQRSAPAIATTATIVPAPTTASTDARPSIAVLPFENRSRLEDDAFFVDGIHDDILTQLSKVSALRVISRTSVEQFRDTKLPMRAIAEQLGVTKILEGGVQRAGDRVRINMQLIDAATDAHVWAERYDRQLTAANVFAIQSEVATAIASALEAALTPREQSRVNAIPTQSLEAWTAYQRGRQRMAKRTSANLAQAEQSFRKAIAIDPKFANAWAGLADALSLQTQYTVRAKDVLLSDAEKAATRALELDPNLAEAWASAGNVAGYRLQHERSEQLFRRAIALNPNYAPAHQWLSHALTDLGRRQDALTEAERAVMLDPFSAIINYRLGSTQALVGRFDDALATLQQATVIDPMMAAPYSAIGTLLASGFGRWDDAVVWYEKAFSLDSDDPEMPTSLASAYWHLEDDAEAERWLTKVQGEGTTDSNALAALLYLSRGDEASARKYAQKAAELDPSSMVSIRDDDLRKGDYTTARARYAKAFPELFAKELPKLTDGSARTAVALALVLQHTGEGERADALLDRSESYFRTIPRMGSGGFRINDVLIHALRGRKHKALTTLREAERAGWRDMWRYYRDFDPALASIRNEPEFKAVFADIQRDMARQRAELAAREKGADKPIVPGMPRKPD
jgi:TolB-like protein/Flp pilus assembly protein TadD